MFDLFKKLAEKSLSNDDIALLLKTNPEALTAFNAAYSAYENSKDMSDNLHQINAKQAVAETKNDTAAVYNKDLRDRIVDELIGETEMFAWNGTENEYTRFDVDTFDNRVTNEEISSIPESVRPQLAGDLYRKDIAGPQSYVTLVSDYMAFKKETNPEKKKWLYGHFRQGLDLLDLDPVVYKMLGLNPNAMGYWLPKLTEPVLSEGFFKIPATSIIKVPLPVLQLTRVEYASLNQITKDIVNCYCQKIFNLSDKKEYFIKTGTFSSKFDFRNAKVSGKEVNDVGEYLIFIQYQANSYAYYDLSGHGNPSIYGVSTTNEWCVREFINDPDADMTIYHGLPLRTEYRAFVDFDTDKIIGMHPYWESDTMKKHFSSPIYADDPDMTHDYITYTAMEEKLQKRYDGHVESVKAHLADIIPGVKLSGQWSIDIMESGNNYYIIDMALAQNSAYYECVPKELRNPSEENWLPNLSQE